MSDTGSNRAVNQPTLDPRALQATSIKLSVESSHLTGTVALAVFFLFHFFLSLGTLLLLRKSFNVLN